MICFWTSLGRDDLNFVLMTSYFFVSDFDMLRVVSLPISPFFLSLRFSFQELMRCVAVGGSHHCSVHALCFPKRIKCWRVKLDVVNEREMAWVKLKRCLGKIERMLRYAGCLML